MPNSSPFIELDGGAWCPHLVAVCRNRPVANTLFLFKFEDCACDSLIDVGGRFGNAHQLAPMGKAAVIKNLLVEHDFDTSYCRSHSRAARMSGFATAQVPNCVVELDVMS